MLEEIIEAVKDGMEKSIEALRRDLAAIRTGRASTAMRDNVRVEYYGNMTPLNQMATISVPEPRVLMGKPWEAKLIPVIEKALFADKSLGLNPSNAGAIIRLPIPVLTEERRWATSAFAKRARRLLVLLNPGFLPSMGIDDVTATRRHRCAKVGLQQSTLEDGHVGSYHNRSGSGEERVSGAWS